MSHTALNPACSHFCSVVVPVAAGVVVMIVGLGLGLGLGVALVVVAVLLGAVVGVSNLIDVAMPFVRLVAVHGVLK